MYQFRNIQVCELIKKGKVSHNLGIQVDNVVSVVASEVLSITGTQVIGRRSTTIHNGTHDYYKHEYIYRKINVAKNI